MSGISSRNIVGLHKFYVGLQLAFAHVRTTGLHIKQQFLQSHRETSLVFGIVFSKGHEFSLHRLLEDLHIDLIIKRKQFIPQLPVNQNFVKINHPLLYLIVYCRVLKEFSKISRNHLLRSRLLTLVVETRPFHLETDRTLKRLPKRESTQLLLNAGHCLKDRRQVILHFLRTTVTISMQVGPILLNQILNICQQISELLYYITGLAFLTLLALLKIDGMHKTSLRLISITKSLFFPAIFAVFRSTKSFFL